MNNNYYAKSRKNFPEKLQKRINKLLSDIIEIYPNKIIVYLRRDYPSLATGAREIRKQTNYIDNCQFFEDFGFQYIDVNIIDLSSIENREEVEKAINDANRKRNKEFLETQEFFESMNIPLAPLSDYYSDNQWKSPYITKKFTVKEQEKINKAFNRLISIYPNRIVFELEKYANKFLEDYINPLKKFLDINSSHEIIEKFGFKIINKSELKKNQLNSIEKYLVNNKWVSDKQKKVDTALQLEINYIFDILYAIFPNRIVTDIKILNKVEGYMNICEEVYKKLNYICIERFFHSFGFIYELNNENEIILPNIIYSPNKNILYKVFESKEKIIVDDATSVIKSKAFENLDFKYLDLCNLSKHSLTIEENAFMNCCNFTTIINPTAIKKTTFNSFNNCSKLNVKQVMKVLMQKYRINCIYSLRLKDINNNYTTINSFNLFCLGTYLKNTKNDKIYLIDKITYFDNSEKINILDINNYSTYNDDLHENRLVFDYNDTTFRFDKDIYGLLYYSYGVYSKGYLGNVNNIENRKIDKNLYKFENFTIPIFENDIFLKYEEVSKDEIINEVNYKIVESLIIGKVANFKNAIYGLNQKSPFTTYNEYICVTEYINTFLKIHNTNPLIFTNSYYLMTNKDFLCKIFELYPYLDTNIILDELLKEKDLMIKILNHVKEKNREKLMFRIGDLI